MELFKPQAPLAIPLDLKVVYVAIVDPDGDSSIGDQPWCKFKTISNFSDLVRGQDESAMPIILLIPDESYRLKQIKLVCDNSGLVETSIIWVKGVSKYSPSVEAENSFWAVKFVDFDEWRLESDEAARILNLAERAKLSPDDVKTLDVTRADGTIKAFQHDAKVRTGIEVDADAIDDTNIRF